MAQDVNKRVAANLAAALMREDKTEKWAPGSAVALYRDVLKLLEDEERGPTLGDDTTVAAAATASHAR